MKLSRRNVLLGAGAAAVGGLGHGFAVEPAWLEVTRHPVRVPGLSAALEGFTFAQITDAHLERIGRVEERVIAAIREAAPQVVFLTGDLVDRTYFLPVLEALCDAIAAPGRNVLGLPGNWEHWRKIGLERVGASYTRTGARHPRASARLQVNEALTVDGVGVAALDDYTGGEPDPSVLGKVRRDGPRILVTHSPALLDELPRLDAPFHAAIAGHTHGGQVRAPGWAPVLPPGAGRFEQGWYDTRPAPLYVSRGTGTSIVPARFLCRPELPLFTLTRA